MKSFWAVPLVLACGLGVVSESAAQFGRPSFRPRITPRPRFTLPPRVAPRLPVTPHRTVIGDPWRYTGLTRYESTAAARAASIVGLSGPPMGQGYLLLTSTLVAKPFPRLLPHSLLAATEASHRERIAALRPAVWAASTVGLLTSPSGQGCLLGTFALLDPEAFANQEPVKTPQNNTRITRSAPAADSGWIFWGCLAALVVVSFLYSSARERILPGIASWFGNGSSRAQTRVRIVALPPGEAPESIRGAWIGLELPVVSGPSARQNQRVYGVMSHHSMDRCDGYAVNGARAVKLLAAQDADAADWWRSNAPHVLRGGYQLVFPAEVCEEVS